MLFIESKPKRADVNRSSEQVFKIDDYISYIIKSIDSNNISAQMGIDKNYSLVKIYHPTVERNFQGHSTHIIGCSTSVQSDFFMVSIDIKMFNHSGNTDKKLNLNKS